MATMGPKHLEALLAEEEEETRDSPDKERPAIVVVDDEETVLRALQALFEDQYRVTVCASAKEGIAAVRDDTCAVILDVRMHGYDGFWACDQIRQRYPDMPVIFYSAYQEVKDPYRIINEHYPFKYIIKDVDTGALVQAVGMAVRLRQVALYSRELLSSLKGTAKRRR